MCKQKPMPQSSDSRDDRRSVDVNPVVSPNVIVVVVGSNGDQSSSALPSSDAMPSVGACYRAPTDKMLTISQDQPSSPSSEVAAADPWSPAIVAGVIPDPRCPRQIDELLQKDAVDDDDADSLPCGSEESLLPRSNSPCFSYAPSSLATDVVTTMSTSTNLYPFSSMVVDEPQRDRNEEVDLICFSPSFAVSVAPPTTKNSYDSICHNLPPYQKVPTRNNSESNYVRWEGVTFEEGQDEEDDGPTHTDLLLPSVMRAGIQPVQLPTVVYGCGSSSMGSSSAQPSADATDALLEMLFAKRLGLPQVRSAAEISVASSTLSQKSLPICRICHLPATEDEQLISPCRCSGTMRFIHTACLMKWLEISSTRSKRPPSCELCLYQYHRHKKFKVSHWQFPQCSRQDKFLHVIFMVSLVIMVGCATATILCFKQDRGVRNSPEKTELSRSEVITLVCGVLFFVAFFVAMYVEVKSHNTIYRLCVKFIYLNQQWYIDEYDKRKDVQPVPV